MSGTPPRTWRTTDSVRTKSRARTTRNSCSACPFTTPSGDTRRHRRQPGDRTLRALGVLRAPRDRRHRRARHRLHGAHRPPGHPAGARAGDADGAARRRSGASTTSPTASRWVRRPTSSPSLGNTLDQLLDRVASAILAEQRLTAELAHELRTPLTNIQGSAGLALMRGVKDPEDREDFEEVAHAARDMSAVIRTLLDVAREGPAAAHEQTCTLADVMPGLLGATDGRVAVDDRTGELVGPHRGAARPGGTSRRSAGRQRGPSRARADHVHGVGPPRTTSSWSWPTTVSAWPRTMRESLFEPGATHGTGGAGSRAGHRAPGRALLRWRHQARPGRRGRCLRGHPAARDEALNGCGPDPRARPPPSR